MKTKNKEELKQIAIDIFKRYPKANQVSCTSDGMAFIVDDGNSAVMNHSIKNRYDKKLPITEFNRDEMMVKTTAKELIKVIEGATEASVVAKIREEEESGEKRKTVLEAADSKLESLKGGE